MNADLLTTDEVAELTRIPTGTLGWYRHRGTGPRSAKLGRRVVYTRPDVEAWIADRFRATARGGVA